jgi:carbamoyl-phosphate synthase large subunit
VRLLFSCAGRRVELITAFIRAARSLKLEAHVHCGDIERLFAASHVARQSHQIPPARSDEYIPALLQIAREHRIDLLVPLLDLELQKLADARDQFRAAGCHVLISSPAVVRACQDKLETFQFLVRHGIDTPQTWLPAEAQALSAHQFPYFFKPRAGSASQGNFVLRTADDLHLICSRHPDGIVQEFVAGTEHTLDVYAGFDGRPRCVVPRERIEVRGGEVTKARTVKNRDIIEVGRAVTAALADCIGLITIQVILTPDGRVRVIEINPRFGGGAPLSIRAGANFPRWLLAEWLGRHQRIPLAGWRENLVMLRYHQSFFDEIEPDAQARVS